MKNKKYFFGWENIKWFCKELMNVYSAKDSYFSKKIQVLEKPCHVRDTVGSNKVYML